MNAIAYAQCFMYGLWKIISLIKPFFTPNRSWNYLGLTQTFFIPKNTSRSEVFTTHSTLYDVHLRLLCNKNLIIILVILYLPSWLWHLILIFKFNKSSWGMHFASIQYLWCKISMNKVLWNHHKFYFSPLFVSSAFERNSFIKLEKHLLHSL